MNDGKKCGTPCYDCRVFRKNAEACFRCRAYNKAQESIDRVSKFEERQKRPVLSSNQTAAISASRLFANGYRDEYYLTAAIEMGYQNERQML